MIYIDRNRIQKPDVLDRKGRVETLGAIAFFRNPMNAGQSFEFKVYSHPDVKAALSALFYDKCAYCESSFVHSYPGDVEHFRPKGEITEAVPNTKPGYYWLAADWDNLLFSCRNCNQRLTHTIHGVIERKSLGKMNQFPLSDSTRYVRAHDNPNGIQGEEPFRLLINPCIDNPEEHLEFGPEGVVRAKIGSNGNPSLKGKTSIDVYVLQRMPLVQAREKVQIEIFAQIQRVKEATVNYSNVIDSNDSGKIFYFEKILKRELRQLRNFLKPEEPYIGMARQIISKFMLTNFNVRTI